VNPQLTLATVTYAGARWIAVGLTLAVLLVAVGLTAASAPVQWATGGKRGSRFLRILVGADGRVSTSRTVALAWTAVVVYILLGLIIANPKSWSDALKNLSPTYLLLLGFPYASLVLAKATVATRVASGSLAKTQPDSGPKLSQLFNDDDDNPDVFDVQYVAFNIVAMVFVVVAFSRAGLNSGFPPIPNGLLLLTGGPASIYISNKFMPGNAPAIFSVAANSVRVGQSFTIIGQNLASSDTSVPNPVVRVGGVAVPAGGTYAPTSITVAAPDLDADLGRAVDVSVTTSDGLQAVLVGALEVLGRVPTLDGIDSGVAQVGQEVGLHGGWSADEANRIMVIVDATVVATTKRPSANALMCVVPPLPDLDPPRSVPIVVKLGDQLSSPPIPLIVSPAASSATNGAASKAASTGTNGSGDNPSSGIRVGL
jgi:hypothetical protein